MATISVKQSGGDFTTLAAALADASTAADDIIEISGSWSVDDTAVCTVADNNITIRAVGDSKVVASALGSPSHYRLRCATNGSHCITVNNTGCVIDGLEIRQGSTGTSNEIIRQSASPLTVKNSILWCNTTTAYQDGIFFNVNNGTVNCENTIIFNIPRGGVQTQNGTDGITQTYNINSCTIYRCATNDNETSIIEAGGLIGRHASGVTLNINVFNTAILETVNISDADYNGDYAAPNNSSYRTGTLNYNIHNCIDSDGSIAKRDAAPFECLASRTQTDSDTPGTGDWVVFDDITDSPYDLRLKSNAENDAQDAHDSTSGAGLTMPTADIAGTTRPQNTNYDIGAFEIVSAAATLEISVHDCAAAGEALH